MRFVLIHGGFHGAWCWERTIPELEALGHEAIAIDLPGHGARAAENPSLADRRDAILAVMQAGDVLVGHSGGGYDISLAADAAPEQVGHMIFLAAALPLEGRPLIEASGGAPQAENAEGEAVTQLMTDETGMLRFITATPDGRMACTDRDAVADFFYHDCDAATVDWAFARLTPAPVDFLLEPVHLPRLWAAPPPRSYIHCLEDRAKPHAMSEQVIARLGVEPLEIDASHSPFLSKPVELAALLVKAAGTKPVGPIQPT